MNTLQTYFCIEVPNVKTKLTGINISEIKQVGMEWKRPLIRQLK